MDLIVLEIFPLTMHTTDSNIPSTDGATGGYWTMYEERKEGKKCAWLKWETSRNGNVSTSEVKRKENARWKKKPAKKDTVRETTAQRRQIYEQYISMLLSYWYESSMRRISMNRSVQNQYEVNKFQNEPKKSERERENVEGKWNKSGAETNESDEFKVME